MKISFFEEFPNKKNLARLSLLNYEKVYVAAKSHQEFLQLTKGIKGAVYWPVLEKKEGYWLSPFSSTKAVKRVIKECQNKKVMWDAELPFRHPWLFLRLDNFFRNIFLIKKFFKENGKNIFCSEYPVKNQLISFIFSLLGVSFSPKKYDNTKIIMYYTSMHKIVRPFMLKNIEKLVQKYGNKLHVALGTIATGILGNEPILKPEELAKDLQDMQKIGVSKVVIFRLEGLDEDYLKVLKEYS